MNALKQCSKCKLFQPMDNYYKNSHSKGGISPICISCIKEKNNDPEIKKHKQKYMKKYRPDYLKRPGIMEHIKEQKKEYRKTPQAREKKRLSSLRYSHKPDVKERELKRRSTLEFKKNRKEYHKKYFSKPEVKIQQSIKHRTYYLTRRTKEKIKQYLIENPDVAKRMNRNHFNKRKNYGITTLFENPFPDDVEVDYHHFNRLLMIPMPRVTHRFVSGSAKILGDHFAHNETWIEKLYCLNLNEVLSEDRGNNE